jgi:periplasmic protein TonB
VITVLSRRIALAAALLLVPAPLPAQHGPVPVPPGPWASIEKLPEPVRRVEPVYPEAARRAGVSGTVLVQVLVRKDGRVGDARVVRSIPMLDPAALEAAWRWRFRPALSGGRPVACWVAIPLRFRPRPVLV